MQISRIVRTFRLIMYVLLLCRQGTRDERRKNNNVSVCGPGEREYV